MRIWTERQIELRGVYEINLTSTALATLLASRHPALAEAKARQRLIPLDPLTCSHPCFHISFVVMIRSCRHAMLLLGTVSQHECSCWLGMQGWCYPVLLLLRACQHCM